MSNSYRHSSNSSNSNWRRIRSHNSNKHNLKSNWRRNISHSNTTRRLKSPSPSPSPLNSNSNSNNWRFNRSHSPSPLKLHSNFERRNLNIKNRHNTKTFQRLSSTKYSLTKINRNNGFDNISSCDNIKNIAIHWSTYFGGSFIDRTHTGYYLSPFKTKLDQENHIHIFKSNKDNTYPGSFNYNDGIISIKSKNKHYVQYKDICRHKFTDYEIASICKTIYTRANYNIIKDPIRNNTNNNNYNNNTTLHKLNKLPEPNSRRI